MTQGCLGIKWPLSTYTYRKELNRDEISLHLQMIMGYLGADSQFKMP